MAINYLELNYKIGDNVFLDLYIPYGEIGDTWNTRGDYWIGDYGQYDLAQEMTYASVNIHGSGDMYNSITDAVLLSANPSTFNMGTLSAPYNVNVIEYNDNIYNFLYSRGTPNQSYLTFIYFIPDIVIPEGITSIADKLFFAEHQWSYTSDRQCKRWKAWMQVINSINLPKSIKKIGKYAFANNISYIDKSEITQKNKYITIASPSELTDIGEGAFGGYLGTEIDLGQCSIENIDSNNGSGIFYIGANSIPWFLQSTNIKEIKCNLNKYAFGYCGSLINICNDNLINVELYSGTGSETNGSFYYSASLENITIGADAVWDTTSGSQALPFYVPIDASYNDFRLSNPDERGYQITTITLLDPTLEPFNSTEWWESQHRTPIFIYPSNDALICCRHMGKYIKIKAKDTGDIPVYYTDQEGYKYVKVVEINDPDASPIRFWSQQDNKFFAIRY